MSSASPSSFVVLKFGGTSVSSLVRWQTIASLIRRRQEEGFRVVVVCSAVSGVSNLLERLLPEAVAGTAAGTLHAIRSRHESLAAELGVPLGTATAELEEVERIASGVALLGEFGPRLQARVMATGELMSTRLGAAWLQSEGVSAEWRDARELLSSEEGPNESRHFLSATCPCAPDATMQQALSSVVITQGFIARDAAGRTVLLGRGGSDTSAAYLAAKLSASRLEIWTDVAGMYTADPRVVPHARLLRRLHFDEAQELAATGAKVLHPRSISPCRDAGIPLWIRSTPEPEVEGTILGSGAASGARVRAITARSGILLLSMETLGMWQEPGFLARAFAVLARHGLSVDLVATSESNVTVSLDSLANALDARVLDAAVAELRGLSDVRVIGPCAAVSLVGRQIRSILHEIGPALEAFAEHRIHLVSQAASDLNLTVVVDEDQASRLVLALHQRLLEGGDATDLGPAWRPPVASEPGWWTARRDALLSAAAVGTPVYVHDLAGVREQVSAVRKLPLDRRFFAMKACPVPEVVAAIAGAGLGLECVSAGEIALARSVAPTSELLFTPNVASRAEYVEAIAAGAQLTVDSEFPLRAWPELFSGRDILLRIDPGEGRGHHRHVRTAGGASKFGLLPDAVPALAALAAQVGARIIGVHAHAGSGVNDPGAWAETAEFLLGFRDILPDLRILDLGGGLGIPYRPGDPRLDLAAVAASLAPIRAKAPGLGLWMEPGRFLVAEAGALLVRVTQVRRKGERCFVGVDAGMNALLRPALYGAWHPIVNLSRRVGASVVCDVVGPICESADVLGRDRTLTDPQEGDVLLIGLAGAYGLAMASTYNSRALPRSVVFG
ncbi:aspartate kinase [Deltaproteobacteria bacterium]|nr:aspartate kinase [Deltaproteobacteria bacterium]